MGRRVSKEMGSRRPLRRPLERNSRERMGFCFSVLAKRANSEMRAKKFSERAALWGKRERLLFWKDGGGGSTYREVQLSGERHLNAETVGSRGWRTFRKEEFEWSCGCF